MDTIDTAQAFLDALPHCKALSMTLDRAGEGWAELSMPYDARLVGDPATGVIAGGPVSVLMDTASGTAVMSHPAARGITATLDLRIDYMRPATPGQRLRARAECHHVTRTVAFVRATTHDDGDTPVAMSTGTFTIVREGGA